MDQRVVDACNNANAILIKYNINFKLDPQEWIIEKCGSKDVIGHSKNYGTDPFKSYFVSLNPPIPPKIYIYKKMKRIIDMVKGDVINFTSLYKNIINKNDDLEYGYLVNFFGFPNPNRRDASGQSNMNIWRKRMFVCCLTTNTDDNHWKKYADNDLGARIEYTFNFNPPPLDDLIMNYGKIFYQDDDNPRLQFMKEIIGILATNKHNLTFTPEGVNKAALMCKRKEDKVKGINYEAECESRIVFDFANQANFYKPVPKGLRIVMDEHKKETGILEVSNHNERFSWTMNGIVAGKNADSTELEELCKAKGIPFSKR